MSATTLQAQLDAAWSRVTAAIEAVEPLLLARIAEIVHERHLTATAIWLEPTDQDHYGWVLANIELADGTRVDDDDQLDDELWPHLSWLGHYFASSDATPSPYRLALEVRE